MGRRYRGGRGGKVVKSKLKELRESRFQNKHVLNRATPQAAEELNHNRDYYYGLQEEMISSRTEVMFKGLLMSGSLPKHWGKQQLRESIQKEIFNKLWKKDKHILLEVVERKDLREGDGKKFFPVLFCNKEFPDKAKKIVTVFGPLANSLEDATTLGKEMMKDVIHDWDNVGVIKERKGDHGDNGKLS